MREALEGQPGLIYTLGFIQNSAVKPLTQQRGLCNMGAWIKSFFAGVVVAIVAVVLIIFRGGKVPKMRQPEITTKHDTTPDLTVDEIEAKYHE